MRDIPEPCNVLCCLAKYKQLFKDPRFRALEPYEQWLSDCHTYPDFFNFQYHILYDVIYVKNVPSLSELAFLKIFEELARINCSPFPEHPIANVGEHTNNKLVFAELYDGNKCYIAFYTALHRPTGFETMRKSIRELPIPELIKREMAIFLEKIPLKIMKWLLYRAFAQIITPSFFPVLASSLSFSYVVCLMAAEAVFHFLFFHDFIFYDCVTRSKELGNEQLLPGSLAHLAPVQNYLHITDSNFWHIDWWKALRARLRSTHMYAKLEGSVALRAYDRNLQRYIDCKLFSPTSLSPGSIVFPVFNGIQLSQDPEYFPCVFSSE